MASVNNNVKELFERGAIQLSRKYRTVAVMPEGKTGMECLQEHYPEEAKHLLERIEENAKDQFLRLHSSTHVELTREEFNEWLQLRGCKTMEGE